MTGNQPCNDDDREIQTDTGERARERERECRSVRERAKEDERARERMVGGVEGDEMMMEGKADTKKN